MMLPLQCATYCRSPQPLLQLWACDVDERAWLWLDVNASIQNSPAAIVLPLQKYNRLLLILLRCLPPSTLSHCCSDFETASAATAILVNQPREREMTLFRWRRQHTTSPAYRTRPPRCTPAGDDGYCSCGDGDCHGS